MEAWDPAPMFRSFFQPPYVVEEAVGYPNSWMVYDITSGTKVPLLGLMWEASERKLTSAVTMPVPPNLKERVVAWTKMHPSDGRSFFFIESPALCLQASRALGINESMMAKLVRGEPSGTEEFHEVVNYLFQLSALDGAELYQQLQQFRTSLQ